MTIYETIQQMLTAHGITKEYTEQQLDMFILEAKLLVDEPFMNNSNIEEYITDFSGDTIYTKEYPVLTDSVEVIIDDAIITPGLVTHTGLIRLTKEYDTKGLLLKYTVGLNEEDIQNYLIPIVCCIIEDREGVNIASVSEGDVSVSYNNSTGYTTRTLDSLVENLRNKYTARVRVI